MRLILALTLLTLIGGVSAARAEDPQFGAKLGPTFGTLTVEAEQGESYNPRIAIAGGPFLVLPLNRNLAVQIEGLYSPKGAKVEVDELEPTSTVLLNYIDFPVLARVQGSNPKSFQVFGGPYVGVRTSARRQLSIDLPGFTTGISENMGGEVERFDAGVILGGGVPIKPRIGLDVRYQWGLRHVNTDRSTGAQFKHRVLTVLVAVRFF